MATLINAKSQSLTPQHLQEKIYLQTDKPYYYPGETIWFSGFINYKSPGLVDTLSRVVYVDLLSPSRDVLQSLILKVDSNRAIGNFLLRSKWASGIYTIRAYTHWLLNYGSDSFFYKSVPLLNTNEIMEDLPPQDKTSETLTIAFDKPYYHARQKVRIKLRLDSSEKQRYANTLISVTDAEQVAQLQSTIDIEKDFYFSDSLPKTRLKKFIYPIERGLAIEGVFIKPEKENRTKLPIIENGFRNIYNAPLGENGFFSVRDLSFYDSINFAFQTGQGKLILKKRELPAVPLALPRTIFPAIKYDTLKKRNAYDTTNSILLQEVKISTTRLSKNNIRRERADFLVESSKLKNYNNVAQAIQSKIPGYRLVLVNMHWQLQWMRSEYSSRSGSPLEPIVYINDSRLLVADATTDGETIGDKLSMLDPSIIDRVEGATTVNTASGGVGSIGVIYIYTKESELPPSKSLTIFKIKGFDREAIFKSPDYEKPNENKNITDLRSTLYWNPKVHVSANIPSEIEFFTSDQKGTLRILVEGVTNTGKPFRVETTILVE